VRGHAEFVGGTPQPTPAQLQQIAVALEPTNGDIYAAIPPSALSEDGHFVTPSSWPGRYLVRVSGAPQGWTFNGASFQGRDVSETPWALSDDVDDITLAFTDRPSRLEGTVQDRDGTPDLGAIVILFPTDQAAWVDYGRTSRRVRSTTTRKGAFTIANPPEGDYYAIAISDKDAGDWQNPSILKQLSVLADRVHVDEGRSTTINLRTKRLP
jgi:hypothetical protein